MDLRGSQPCSWGSARWLSGKVSQNADFLDQNTGFQSSKIGLAIDNHHKVGKNWGDACFFGPGHPFLGPVHVFWT